MARALAPTALLLILTGLNLFNYFDRFILASLVESIRKEFVLTDVQCGTLSTGFMLGYFLTSPIFGYLGDRSSRKWLIASGVFVWSLATVLSGYASSYWELLSYRVLVGFGEASYATLSPGLISDVYPAKKRNFALTIFYTAIPLGAALGTLFGSHVGAAYGWRYAFLWAGTPGLLLAFILVPFAEPRRGGLPEEGGVKDEQVSARGVFGMLKDLRLNLVLWGYVAYTFALGAYQYWGQAFLQRVYGISQQAAGSFFGQTLVVTGLAGTFLGGLISTKLRQRYASGYALTIALSITLAVPLIIVFTFTESVLIAKASVALAMFLLFLPTSPVNTVILECVPASLRSSVMAISIFAIHAFGDLWSPMIVGKASDYFGTLRAGFAVLPIALAVCALFWWLLFNNFRKQG